MGHINQHVCERILGDLKGYGRRSRTRIAAPRCMCRRLRRKSVSSFNLDDMTSVQPPWDDATQPRENWALYSSPVVCCAASCCTAQGTLNTTTSETRWNHRGPTHTCCFFDPTNTTYLSPSRRRKAAHWVRLSRACSPSLHFVQDISSLPARTAIVDFCNIFYTLSIQRSCMTPQQ